MTTEFTSGPDWECSSGPILIRDYDASADLWPHGADSELPAGDKDVLEDGLHPVLAIGIKDQRPINLTGVVVSYNSVNDRAQMNLGEKVCVKSYVANVTAYSGTTAWTFDASIDIGAPVYVDDSSALGAGVTLSRSPLNNNGGQVNPLAGYIHYCQDDYVDTAIGGAGAHVSYPRSSGSSLTQYEYCVLLTNDYGTGDATLT